MESRSLDDLQEKSRGRNGNMKYPEFKCPRCHRILKKGDWTQYSENRGREYWINCHRCHSYYPTSEIKVSAPYVSGGTT